MAPNPMNMKKQSPPSSTIASSSPQEILVRETLRISANLASSSPLLETTTPPPLFESAGLRWICCEEIDGRRWKYVAETDSSGRFKKNSFRPLSLQTPQAPLDVSRAFLIPILIFCS